MAKIKGLESEKKKLDLEIAKIDDFKLRKETEIDLELPKAKGWGFKKRELDLESPKAKWGWKKKEIDLEVPRKSFGSKKKELDLE